MTINDIFISYSRRNLAFAQQLVDALQLQGLKVWFDQKDIPFGVDFQEEINDGIACSNAFLFIISPAAVRSPYCLKEIEYAAKSGMRMIPVLAEKPTLEEEEKFMHPAIRSINWLTFKGDAYSEGAEKVRDILQEHHDYVELHTRFYLQALDWEKSGRPIKKLLTSDKRIQAQAWLERRFSKGQQPCRPSDLHCEFIAESKKNANHTMTDVFMAHTGGVKEEGAVVRKQLMQHGITVWHHEYDIPPGDNYDEAVKRGIEQADWVIVLLSEATIALPYAADEIAYAKSISKKVVPVKLEEVDISSFPKWFRNAKHIDGKGKIREGHLIAEVLEELKREADYHHYHKVLLTQALKWQRLDKSPSMLLRGYNLQYAEAWLKSGNQKNIKPTDLQAEFITTSAMHRGQLPTQVFISYSRSDADFARKLNYGLQASGKTTWFDQESISSGVDFEQEILKLGFKLSTSNKKIEMRLIEDLKWRYATKKFDASKKISEEQLQQILEAVNLSATSYGLQAYKVLVVENPEVREKLKPASWGQTQITDASHLIVLCNYKEITPAYIDEFVARKSDVQGIPLEALQGYGDFMKSKLVESTAEATQVWTAKQTYIALGNLLAACAELKIDACPMEGFEPAQYDEILGLSEKGLSAAVVATIGYRSEEDPTINAPKVRKPLEELVERV